MTKYLNAVYRDNEVSVILSLSEIAHHKEFNEVRNHLYCTGLGCHAQLGFYQQSNGHTYLKKYPSTKHAKTCEFFDASGTYSRPELEYIEQNGTLTPKGISRRKRAAQDALTNYLTPQKNNLITKHIAATPKTKSDSKMPKKTIIRIKYDPSAPVVNSDDKSNDAKIVEPAFFQRFPHQLTIADSNKNLKTSSRILSISLDEKKFRCTIKTEFEHVTVLFSLPEVFFNSSKQRIIPAQLIGFLKILKKFINHSDTIVYLTTMCQSQRLNPNSLKLFVLDYDFLSFQSQTIKGTTIYKDLAAIAAAISTGALT